MLKINKPAFAGIGALAGIGGVAAYINAGNTPLPIPAYLAMGAAGVWLIQQQDKGIAEAAGAMLVTAGVYGGYKRLEMPADQETYGQLPAEHVA